MGWVLQAPPSITGQMTGAWLAQDSRRLWVFDKETYYGTHVGVVGVYAMNDACFTMPDVSVSSGLYTRRPSINGCYPWPRPGTAQVPAYALTGLVESVDLKSPAVHPHYCHQYGGWCHRHRHAADLHGQDSRRCAGGGRQVAVADLLPHRARGAVLQRGTRRSTSRPRPPPGARRKYSAFARH